MKNLLFLFLFSCSLGLSAQTGDSACAVIKKVHAMLKSKDERAKLKGALLEGTPGSLSKSAVYRSTIAIPGMTDAVFAEGLSRGFRAYINARSYEEAVKQLQAFNDRMHACFVSDYTFTESNEPRELSRSYKIVHDKDLLAGTPIRYFLERHGETFRLVLEMSY